MCAIASAAALLLSVTMTLPQVLILQDYHRPLQHQQRLFYHPLMQTEMMVIGMSMCYLAYLLLRKKDGEVDNVDKKQNAPVLVCCIPLMMDLVASSLELISLNYIAGSVYSISNCIVIVSTAFFSRIILKTVFNKHQILGCVLTVLGVVIAGIGESLNDTSEDDDVSIELDIGSFYFWGDINDSCVYHLRSRDGGGREGV